MATSRYLDIRAYCEKGDTTFYYLNSISSAQYGKHHGDGSQSNRSFIKLIESYKKNGYVESSLLTVDKYCNIIDGTHRIGANLFYGYGRMNVKMVKRSSITGLWQTPDQYFRTPLASKVIGEILEVFNSLQLKFIENGNTFCCILWNNYENDKVSLVSDLRVLTNVLHISNLRRKESKEQGVIVQFSLGNPLYRVKNGIIFSSRAAKVEELLKRRRQMFELETEIIVSKSCLEGKELFDQVFNEMV